MDALPTSDLFTSAAVALLAAKINRLRREWIRRLDQAAGDADLSAQAQGAMAALGQVLVLLGYGPRE